MKNIINRRASKRVTSFFRTAGANYDKQKNLIKLEKQKEKNNNDKGEKKAC